MSKISRENKAAKLKGKPAKTAASKASKAAKAPEAERPTRSALEQIPNYGKCCTCSHYCRPVCRSTKAYTARKSTCPNYKH